MTVITYVRSEFPRQFSAINLNLIWQGFPVWNNFHLTSTFSMFAQKLMNIIKSLIWPKGIHILQIKTSQIYGDLIGFSISITVVLCSFLFHSMSSINSVRTIRKHFQLCYTIAFNFNYKYPNGSTNLFIRIKPFMIRSTQLFKISVMIINTMPM